MASAFICTSSYYLIGAVLIIAVGRLIDPHGPRGVLAYGVCAMAGALALLGQITALWQLFAVYVCSGVGHYEAPACRYLRGNCGPPWRRPS
jgi:MFS family permease